MPVIVQETCGSTAMTWSAGPKGTHTEQFVKVGAAASAEANVTTHKSNIGSKLMRIFESTFLPEGYPESVSKDYARYQVFDTLQALCSSITGTLSTRAVLKGVGVGDAEASAMGALVSWLLRDGAGMLGRILFASFVASDLDHDAKRWRLAADVTNDIGMMINILSEHVARVWFLPLVCLASLFFAVTGCAGGATRASLTQHFALRHNTADVSAKDGSQETAVGLIGMLLGTLVAYLVPATFEATLAVVMLFTALHLISNYLGVKALVLEHLNENRLVLCLQAFRERKGASVTTPSEMARIEGVILPGPRISNVTMGVSLRAAVEEAVEWRKEQRGTTTSSETQINALRDEIAVDAVNQLTEKHFAVVQVGAIAYRVVLSESADHMCLFRAYCECVGARSESEKFHHALQDAGWKTDRFQLRLFGHRVVSKGTRTVVLNNKRD